MVEDVLTYWKAREMNEPVPHFELEPALMDLIPFKEAEGMLKMLADANLLTLPYDAQTITICGDEMVKRSDWSWGATEKPNGVTPVYITVKMYGATNQPAGEAYNFIIDIDPLLVIGCGGRHSVVDMETGLTTGSTGKMPASWIDGAKRTVSRMMILFVAALNTRNVVQHTTHNPRATTKPHNSKGIFKTGNLIHKSCTRLSMPNLGQGGTGRTVRPHWRCGHLHWWPKADGTKTVKFLPAKIVALANGPVPVHPPIYQVRP